MLAHRIHYHRNYAMGKYKYKCVCVCVCVCVCACMYSFAQPANIFLFGSERRVKIGDFGLARAYMSLPNGKAGARDAMTSRELIVSSSTAALALSSDVGTASYTSPEQLQNKPYDAKVLKDNCRKSLFGNFSVAMICVMQCVMECLL